MDSSGKVITVFYVIIAILLVSLTAYSLFYLQKESELRKLAETKLEKSLTSEIKLEAEAKELRKQNALLVEKNKDADDKINGLIDDLDLERGLKEQLKKESIALKEQLDKAVQEKEKSQQDIDKLLSESQKRALDLEANLQKELVSKKEIETQLAEAKKKNSELQAVVTKIRSKGESGDDQSMDDVFSQPLFKKKVDLDKIVVVPSEIPEGRILTVDSETEFVIIDLGAKDGLKVGNILSVYRGQDYLGDIRITRVQPEMAAADFIPPFSSRRARKNDQVIIKK